MHEIEPLLNQMDLNKIVGCNNFVRYIINLEEHSNE